MATEQQKIERARALHVELGINSTLDVIMKLREEFGLDLLEARDLAEEQRPLSFKVRERLLGAWDHLTRLRRYHDEHELPMDEDLQQAKDHIDSAMEHLKAWALKHTDFELPSDT